MFYEFIWPTGKHHVKRDVLIQNIEEGGMQMPDIFSFCQAVKLTWFRRLINEDCYLNKVVSYISGTDLKLYICGKVHIDLIHKFPKFYKQIFEFWNVIHNVQPKSATDVVKEVIWHNKLTLIENNPVFYSEWFHKGIVHIGNIIDGDGKLLTMNTLNRIYGIEIDQMKYNSIISAIPKEWKRLLKGR